MPTPHSHFRLTPLLVTFIPLINLINGQGNMCGVAAPDPMKTCISVRLPWQPEPLYFCMEKEKFRYRSQCRQTKGNCGLDLFRNDTLVVSTPWDCCPFASMPDPCMTSHCPPAPMGRTCTEISIGQPVWGGDCCPSYWCEEGGIQPDGCRMKRLDPMCVNPPQGKTNCVAFHDPHGCCTKFQCDGEGKPGLCPAQHHAMEIQMRLNTTHAHMMNMSMKGVTTRNAASSRTVAHLNVLEPHAESVHHHMERGMPVAAVAGVGTSCISDANCPDALKCCSHDMSSYGDGRFVMRNMNPTHGQCLNPVMMAPIPAT
ncbi:uncharacterized protein LOC110858833 [Folsomia candida]|uniref:WAP domain-containing protein n=1 Tax=Folsomia candida TaxID=158441 RepID=A0A226DEV8_FOLCA|nr:uncharacterized protein LOC110858833 [Folsomia candida]OXA43508.1 hypothetical protein Fcan01_21788 [Folsomia candida]